MRFLRVVMLAATVLSAVSLNAQTADEVINKYIDALGGKDKLTSIKTVYTEYDMEFMGQTLSGATWLVNGKAYKNEMTFSGQKIIQCFTDKGAWGLNPMMGQTTPEAMPAEQAKMGQDRLDPGGPLFNYATKGYTVELVGKEDVNGKSAFKLKLKSKEGTESTHWIDAATYYLLKSSVTANMNGTDVETSMAFSNYQKTDGFAMPTNTEITMGQGMTLNLTNKKTEINKDVDMTMFDMPK